MLGPSHIKPISLHVFSLMIRDKQDYLKKRTIVDLSLPKGASVNAAVQKDFYLGTQYVLNYSSLDLITSSLIKLGPAALIYKVYISRPFRQLKWILGILTYLELNLKIIISLINRSPSDTEMAAKFFRGASTPYGLLWYNMAFLIYLII